MLNKRASGESASKVRILAGGAVTAGVPRFEQGHVGFPVVSVASGAYYAMDLEGVFEIDLVGAPAIGDPVYITRATQVVGLVAAAGNSPFAKVVALASGAFGTKEPPTGKMWVRMLPQLATQP